MTIKSATAAFATLIIAIIVTTSLAQAAGYTITDLGSLVDDGSLYAEAEAINNSQQVTGYIRWSNDTGYGVLPFFYDGTVMQDLSTQLGSGTYAWALNDLGHITGSNGNAFIYDGNSTQDLGTLGGDSSTGYAINDAGEVAGTSEFSDTSSDEHAFYYDGDTMHDLGTLGGDESRGYGINSFGEIVGRSLITGPSPIWNPDVWHAYIYSDNQMVDLGTLGGGDEDESDANDINDFGQVTGSSDTGDGSSHAFLYDQGVMQDLGTLGGDSSWGNSINNDGYVVGASRTAYGNATAFLYDGSEMLNLCDLTDCSAKGWTWLQTAKDINEAGVITGEGIIGGESHIFLITWNDQPMAELCTDGIDNDNDGLSDCDDVEDCGQRISCYVPAGMAYDLIDLGTLGGDYSQGISINNIAQVSGDSSLAHSDAIHAFYYNGNGMQDLGMLSTNDMRSHGRGINDDGQITGYSVASGAPMDDAYYKLFLYDNGNLINLHPLFGDDCDESAGYAINNSGHITGTCTQHIYDMWTDEVTYAFMYDGNTVTMLTDQGQDSYGKGINDNGLVTGSTWFLSGSHAFIYDGVMHDLGTLGGSHSSGNDINNFGQVTGYSSLADYKGHGFFYDGSTMHDLGAYEGGNSTGVGINESGQIVGNSDRANGEDTAFLYDRGRMLSVCALTDCKDKGWSALIWASDINDHGDITGVGFIDGEIHAFLAIAHTETVAITSIIYLLLQ